MGTHIWLLIILAKLKLLMLQIFRFRDEAGSYKHDVIGLRSDLMPDGEELLKSVMLKGQLHHPLPDLEKIRNRFKSRFLAKNEQGGNRKHDSRRSSVNR